MSKLKTTGEWLDELRPDIREKAIQNILAKKQKSLYLAIEGAFIWSGSAEGHNFWEDIYNSIESGSTEFLKPTEQ